MLPSKGLVTSTQCFRLICYIIKKNMWLSHIYSEGYSCGCVMTGLWEDRFYNQDHLTATTTADPKHFDLEIAPNIVVCTCTRISGMGITSSTHSFVLRQWFCHLSMGTIPRFLNCWKCTWCTCSSCRAIQIACFNIWEYEQETGICAWQDLKTFPHWF